MYPHYTVPTILSGLYNYYPHVPSLQSPYHFIYTFAVLPLTTSYPPFITLFTLYHFTQVGLLQFNPCPYRLSSTNNLIRSQQLSPSCMILAVPIKVLIEPMTL